MEKYLDRASDFLFKLTWSRVAMGATVGVLVILGRYAWDNPAALTGILSNSVGVIGIAVSLSLLALGMLARWGVDLLERKSDKMNEYLREHVLLLNRKDSEQELELALIRRAMADVQASEKQCQRRVRRMEQALRAANIAPPLDSTWGEL